MDDQTTGAAQAALWNGSAGQAWTALQELIEQMYAPFEALLAAAVAGDDRQVLDVGCGTGATTMAIARQLAGRGACLGVDISQPMIDAASARARTGAAPAAFLCADAATHPFAPASVDLVVSRFGVMFFDDPVAAFANLRRAVRGGGRLDLIVWRGPDENPFMTVAETAAAGLLPLPPREPGAPGQFAFADRGHVEHILEEGGWSGIGIDALDVACSFPGHGLLPYLSRMGPVGRMLESVDETTRSAVLRRVCAAFEPYVEGGMVRFDAACWRVRASA